MNYPGTPQHQALLERIAHFYENDSRILALGYFGSLARGNWDRYSDLDLDVVIADDVQIDVLHELHSLCAAFEPLGERPLIIVPDGEDAGDVVLASLTELSIRYHTLATTSPNIVDDLCLLVGSLSLETIQQAGRANRRPKRTISSYEVDRVLRWAVEVNLRVQRQQFWQAERLLQFMRQTLIDIFAVSRGHARAYHAFEAEAADTLKERLGATLPGYCLNAISETLIQMLDLLENDLDTISNRQLQLTNVQRELIARLRKEFADQALSKELTGLQRLYRPVGLFELRLIRDSGYRAFPPRLPHQPIFYPVLNQEYATQIARDWNTTDEKSGYMGVVTAFDLDAAYLAQFEEQTVGSAVHRELWIPAEKLDDFNAHIIGSIRVLSAFYGENFSGEKDW